MPNFNHRNKLVFDADLYGEIREIANIFKYDYGDWVAADNFVTNCEYAIDNLTTISVTDGIPADETLRQKGYRRMLIKKYKYIIIYTYKDQTVYIHGIFPSQMDFSQIF